MTRDPLNRLVHVLHSTLESDALSDSALLDRVRANRDPSAVEAIVRRHGSKVLAACRKVLGSSIEADDAFQSTFLILLRNPSAVKKKASLGAWLFGVAHRTALRVRSQRGCGAEPQAAVAACEPDLSWREACGILHQELDRLPERHRVPLVLCYLDGLSRDEAATQLGRTLPSVKKSLERGRELLRGRLQKRGVTLSAGLLATLAGDHAVALPSRLVSATLAAGRGKSQPTIDILRFATWKGASMIGVAAAILIVIAFHDLDVSAQPPSKSKSSASPVPAKTDVVDPKVAMVAGRVVNPEGKPVSGAKIFVRFPAEKDAGEPLGESNADGRFKVPLSLMSVSDRATVIAHAAGFAATWQTWTGHPPEDLNLKLVKDDVPVSGRILDLEGKPIRGAIIRVNAVQTFPNDGPEAFVQWLAGRRSRPLQNTVFGVPPGAPARAETDSDGKFQLHGIGRDRVAHVHVAGPAIASESIYVLTVKSLETKESARSGKIYPATFDYAAPPSRPIRGTVRDAVTRKPIAGMSVNGFGGLSKAVTDKDGRYELSGYKKRPRYSVYARPADGSTYMPAMAQASDLAGLDQLEIDVNVTPGIQIKGRVRDTVSGKPVAGELMYYALAGNPRVLGIPVGEFYTQAVEIQQDGTFTIAALPGPGFIGLTVKDGSYPAACVDATPLLPKGFNPKPTKDRLWITVGGQGLTSIDQESYQAILLLDVNADKPPGEQHIDLTPAEPIRGRILAPDGKPLTGVRIRGMKSASDDWRGPLASADFTATPPHPDRPRRLTFRHEGRKLVGTLLATSDGKPTEAKLEPWGTLTGRFVEMDGKPIAHATLGGIGVNGPEGASMESVRVGTEVTDEKGAFQLVGLIPGVEYELYFREITPKGRSGIVGSGIKIKPGEKRDLGELKIQMKEPE